MVQNANSSTQIHHDTTSITTQKIQLSDIPTNSHNLLLGLSALSFFTSLTGSALYARRKGNISLMITSLKSFIRILY